MASVASGVFPLSCLTDMMVKAILDSGRIVYIKALTSVNTSSVEVIVELGGIFL